MTYRKNEHDEKDIRQGLTQIGRMKGEEKGRSIRVSELQKPPSS